MELLNEVAKYYIELVLGAVVGTTARLYTKYIATQRGVQLLLGDNIIQEYEKRTQEGYMPSYAKTYLEKKYKQYKKLGGNSVVDEMFIEMTKLPPQRKED